MMERLVQQLHKNLNVKYGRLRHVGVLLGFLVLCIVTAALSEAFLTTTNLINILRQVSINGILAAGLTLVIITGGIDLSVGSVLALTSAIAVNLIQYGFFPAVIVALLLGGILGAFTGLGVTKLNIPPFVATLGMMATARGLTLVYTGGYPLMPPRNTLFRFIGSGYVGPIPVPVIIACFVFLFFDWLLRNTRFGRYIYAVGSNDEAANLSGVNVDKTRLVVYVISGLCAALAGLVLTARLYSAGPRAGEGYELDAIASVVIGGASLMGGEGRMIGTVIGVLIIGVLSNSFNLLGVPAPYQDVFKGLIIVASVAIDTYSKKRR